MSQQQADMLTTELEAYRKIITPRSARLLEIRGVDLPVSVKWADITLQDETEHARARLYTAQAEKLLKEGCNDG